MAAIIDRELWGVLEAALGFQIPRTSKPIGDLLPQVPVFGLEDQIEGALEDRVEAAGRDGGSLRHILV